MFSFNQYFFSYNIPLVLCFVLGLCSDVPRPRGVSLSKAPLYSPSKDFTCLDGSATIPFTQVNDDYCDCFDGSDEPGTAACINGIFHCTNAGHKPQNIPSSRVNDGICDCCDGSDEYAHPTVTCANICDELGREARAEAQRKMELVKLGSQIRADLIQKGNKRRSDMANQLKQLEKDKAEAESMVSEKENIKNDAESVENDALRVYREADELDRAAKAAEEDKANRQEANDIFKKFDSDENGLITLSEIQTRSAFDKDKNGEVSEDEAKYFLAENTEVDLDIFVSEAWPLIKPFLMIEQGIFKPPVNAAVGDLNGDKTDGEAPDAEFVDQDNEHEIDEQDEEHETEEPEDESTTPSPYDEETQKLVDAATDARKQHTDAERVVREIDNNIKNIKDSLEKDYGPQQEFATLDGQCLEYEDKEYIYKLCVFGRATQKAKNGGAEINLGSWGEWQGTDTNPYQNMKYLQGTSCWNGPNRNTRVNIQCGLETKITSVNEPFRCEYVFEMITPAACDENQLTHSVEHDEL